MLASEASTMQRPTTAALAVGRAGPEKATGEIISQPPDASVTQLRVRTNGKAAFADAVIQTSEPLLTSDQKAAPEESTPANAHGVSSTQHPMMIANPALSRAIAPSCPGRR
jgi:hypothetical protein